MVRSSSRRRAVARALALAVLATLLTGPAAAAPPAPPPAATAPLAPSTSESRVTGPPGSPAEVVDAVTEAWDDASLPGTLAVVVAKQHRRAEGLGLRAAEARAARTAARSAGNGPAATRAFPTASMVKLFLAEDLLHRDREGRLSLSADDRDLIERMLTRSSDPAASALWVRYDGERMVRDVAERYDLDGTRPPPVPGQWGQTVTTAHDLARFLTLLPVVAHPDDADRILELMQAITPEAADGFDQRFGLFGAADGTAAVKQGWMCCVDGQRHVHSVGVLGRRVVVLFAEVPRGVGYGAVRDALTAAAAEVPPPRRP